MVMRNIRIYFERGNCISIEVNTDLCGWALCYLLSWKPSTISVRLDFLKCVQIFIIFSKRKSRHTFCTDLRFEEDENLPSLKKI